MKRIVAFVLSLCVLMSAGLPLRWASQSPLSAEPAASASACGSVALVTQAVTSDSWTSTFSLFRC